MRLVQAERAARAAVRTAAAPPSARPARGETASASQPTIGAPIAVEPMKSMPYSAIVRPRICDAEPSCTAELVPAEKLTLAAPTATNDAIMTGNVGATADRRVSPPNAVALRIRKRASTTVREPIRSAPTMEPTASAAMSAA